ncbi:MAG: DUF167 domain-containing protein [Pseudomonadota bacterium]|nr:DUF167 domain-containing protein [Pseudomonadota bacterium]
MKLTLKVAPKAAHNAISGWMGSVLKISVTAVPERGKANEAVIELLADALKLPKSSIAVLRGRGSAQKVVQIDGLADGEILRRLTQPNP